MPMSLIGGLTALKAGSPENCLDKAAQVASTLQYLGCPGGVMQILQVVCSDPPGHFEQP